jgi:hypothetical protein
MKRWSRGQGEFGECGCQAQRLCGVGGEFVVAAAEVLDEGASDGDYFRIGSA